MACYTCDSLFPDHDQFPKLWFLLEWQVRAISHFFGCAELGGQQRRGFQGVEILMVIFHDDIS